MSDITYSGFAAPVGPDWKPVNGSRGHRRDQSVDIDYGVVHFWVSPEDGPERYLRQLRTPALPGSGVCYQSSDGRGGWSWESPTGARITNPALAKLYHGKTYTILRYRADPYTVVDGSPMPWCYGPGYPCVLGVDGNFHFAANPDEIACNHAPPFNERSIGAVMPGTYQTDDQWKDATSIAELLALAKLMVYSWHRWQIPIRYCNATDLIAGIKGWTGHRDVNEMQRRLGHTGVSNHGDPGANMPWGYVVWLALKLLSEEGTTMAQLAKVNNDLDFAYFEVNGTRWRWVPNYDLLVQAQRDGLLPTATLQVPKANLAKYHLDGPAPIDEYPTLTTVAGSDFASWNPEG